MVAWLHGRAVARWLQAANDHGTSSTIQYHGDRDLGGYDACCDFVSPSRCRWKRELAASAEHNASADDPGVGGAEAGATVEGAGGSGAGTHHGQQPQHLSPQQQARLARYAEHDCPVSGLFTVEVSRPLHVRRDGRWAGVL